MEPKKYIEENLDRFLDELFELIRVPSVSSDSKHEADMRKAADVWVKHLLAAGVDTAEIFETDGHPVVLGEKFVGEGLPTVMVYAHYDVMPADPLELWDNPPFDPIVKDGKIWARGADDDKGQSFMHAKAFEYVVKEGLLKCNVKFLIEGEEEIGSGSLPAFIDAHRDKLDCDIILVSDTGMVNPGQPTITSGLRGLAYWQVEVTGPSRDLHSGIFGGAVANPINELCKMIADLTNEENKVIVPGFYDDVRELSGEERKLVNQVPYDEQAYKDEIGVKCLNGEQGYSTTERTGIRPSFDVCGIWGGFAGEGAKTVLPSKAYAKLSSRLVANQDYVKIGKMLKTYLEENAPDYVNVSVEVLHGGKAYECPIDMPAYQAAARACETVFGMPPVPYKSGGSIPIISIFEEKLGAKSILLGFGLASDAIHSPNENYPIENFKVGIETIIRFYEEYTK